MTDASSGYNDRLAGYYDKWYRYNRPDGGAEYDKGVRLAANSGLCPIDRFTMIECCLPVEPGLMRASEFKKGVMEMSEKKIVYADIWEYDVWGNENDGYEVNDRSCTARKQAFMKTAWDSEKEMIELSRRFFFIDDDAEIELSGDDFTIYVDADNKPVGEFQLVDIDS